MSLIIDNARRLAMQKPSPIPENGFMLRHLKCPRCDSDLVQKPRLRLIVAGLLMIAAPGIAHFVPWFWAPAIILVLAGVYLLAWATIGGGRWCRQCKQFVMVPKE